MRQGFQEVRRLMRETLTKSILTPNLTKKEKRYSIQEQYKDVKR